MDAAVALLALGEETPLIWTSQSGVTTLGHSTNQKGLPATPEGGSFGSMAKQRTKIPKATRDAVLREFNHRCAICAGNKPPQLHHIDENPNNNDRTNLIPLCPNCHLTDHHNPTAEPDPARLLLFRMHKDPAILQPQFVPLFTRLRFLDDVTDTADASELQERAEELCRFVAVLNMGEFYKKEMETLIKRPSHAYMIRVDGRPDPEFEAAWRRHEQQYREQLRAARDKVYGLAVELLRYQSW